MGRALRDKQVLAVLVARADRLRSDPKSAGFIVSREDLIELVKAGFDAGWDEALDCMIADISMLRRDR